MIFFFFFQFLHTRSCVGLLFSIRLYFKSNYGEILTWNCRAVCVQNKKKVVWKGRCVISPHPPTPPSFVFSGFCWISTFLHLRRVGFSGRFYKFQFMFVIVGRGFEEWFELFEGAFRGGLIRMGKILPHRPRVCFHLKHPCTSSSRRCLGFNCNYFHIWLTRIVSTIE